MPVLVSIFKRTPNLHACQRPNLLETSYPAHFCLIIIEVHQLQRGEIQADVAPLSGSQSIISLSVTFCHFSPFMSFSYLSHFHSNFCRVPERQRRGQSEVGLCSIGNKRLMCGQCFKGEEKELSCFLDFQVFFCPPIIMTHDVERFSQFQRSTHVGKSPSKLFKRRDTLRSWRAT